jgi:hypothetical protein
MSKDSPTIDELVEIIVADMKNSAATGQPLKYPAIDQIRASRDEWASMHDMPTAFGKSHGECTLREGKMLDEAYKKIGKMHLGNEGK